MASQRARLHAWIHAVLAKKDFAGALAIADHCHLGTCSGTRRKPKSMLVYIFDNWARNFTADQEMGGGFGRL